MELEPKSEIMKTKWIGPVWLGYSYDRSLKWHVGIKVQRLSAGGVCLAIGLGYLALGIGILL